MQQDRFGMEHNRALVFVK